MKSKLPVPRHPYDRQRVQFETSGVCRVVQSQKQQADINHIVRKYAETGVLPQGSEGQFIDTTGFSKDPAELIMLAREVVHAADHFAAEQRDLDAKAKQQRQLDLEDEINRLKKLVSETPSSPSQGAPDADT